MTVIDPTKLSIQTGEHSFRSTVRQILAGLYTFTTGNEYLTLGAALQIGTDPAGTPAANTLYMANICKAWINFNGTGTIAIRESFNVTSITDNGTGDYTVTWDRDFANANPAIASGISHRTGVTRHVHCSIEGPAVGSCRVIVFDSAANTTYDEEIVRLIAFGAQA